jgi:hypothetical protein
VVFEEPELTIIPLAAAEVPVLLLNKLRTVLFLIVKLPVVVEVIPTTLELPIELMLAAAELPIVLFSIK